MKIGPVTLAPSTAAGKSSGLTFHYAPYAVGAYAYALLSTQYGLGFWAVLPLCCRRSRAPIRWS